MTTTTTTMTRSRRKATRTTGTWARWVASPPPFGRLLLLAAGPACCTSADALGCALPLFPPGALPPSLWACRPRTTHPLARARHAPTCRCKPHTGTQPYVQEEEEEEEDTVGYHVRARLAADGLSFEGVYTEEDGSKVQSASYQ